MGLRLRGNKEEQEGELRKKKIDQGEATLLGKSIQVLRFEKKL